MNKLLGISARRSGGKDSTAHFIVSQILPAIRVQEGDQEVPLVDWSRINDEGKLVVPAALEDGSIGEGILDLDTRNPDTLYWLAQNVDPFVRVLAYANPIKRYCADVLGLDWNKLNGSPADKAEPTKYTWACTRGKLPKGVTKDTPMTYRDVVIYIGEFFRGFDEDAWVNATFLDAESSDTGLTIIKDVRRLNEFEAIERRGGKTIRLLRDPYNDQHDTETALDSPNFDINRFSVVIDNIDMTLEETCMTVFNVLRDWEFI